MTPAEQHNTRSIAADGRQSFPDCTHCGGWGRHEAYASRPCPKCGNHRPPADGDCHTWGNHRPPEDVAKHDGPKRRRIIGRHDRAIMAVLDHYWERYWTSPTFRQIADAIGVNSTAEVSKAMTRLVDLGVLERRQSSPRKVMYRRAS